MASVKSFDVIVIGAGIEGSSTAYNLVKNGHKVLLLEQFPLPHSRGSSHGQSRITRYAYAHDFYVRMMADAFPMWARLEQESGQSLFVNCGVLDLRQEGSAGCKKVAKALQTHAIPHEVISPRDFRSRYPMFKVKDNVGAVLDPNGGLLKADKAIKAFQTVYQNLGGTIKDRCPVTSIIPGDSVKVVTPEAVFSAPKVVIAAGPWAGKLTSALGLTLPFTTYKAHVYYWRPRKDKTDLYHFKNMPCFLDSAVDDDHYHAYGLPIHEYPGLVKICLHGGPHCDPDARDRVEENPLKAAAIREIQRQYPWLEDTPVVKEDCIITKTPDGHPYIDRHPKYPNIVLAACFCGHGFKLAPAVGKAVSEMVSGSNPSYNMEPFRIDRFKPKPKM